MGRFIKGDVVVVPFPFSNLTMSKRRPALVVTDLAGDDLILCQITSQDICDKYAVELHDSDFESGSLNKPSNIRPIVYLLLIDILCCTKPATLKL